MVALKNRDEYIDRNIARKNINRAYILPLVDCEESTASFCRIAEKSFHYTP
jgi:hypothetical protein